MFVLLLIYSLPCCRSPPTSQRQLNSIPYYLLLNISLFASFCLSRKVEKERGTGKTKRTLRRTIGSVTLGSGSISQLYFLSFKPAIAIATLFASSETPPPRPPSYCVTFSFRQKNKTTTAVILISILPRRIY